MKHQLRVAIALMFLGVCPLLISGQNGYPSVRSLVKDSEIIVVGMASPVNSSGATWTSLTIRVDRVIKGSVNPGDVLAVTRDPLGSSGCSQEQPEHPAHAVWFLNAGAAGSYQFLPSLRGLRCDPFNSSFEMQEGPLPAQWSYGPAVSTEDKLAYELASTITADQSNGPWMFIHNPVQLSGASAPALRDIYTKLENASALHVHLAGVLGLVRMGDPDTISYLESNLSQLVSTPMWTTVMSNGQQIPVTYGVSGSEYATYGPVFAGAIRDISNPSGATVLALGSLLGSPSATIEMRRAVAHTLQNNHSSLAVQELASLLADSDEELRDDAIGGLACFANGAPEVNSDGRYSGPDLNQPSPYKSKDTLQHFAMGVQTISQREDYYLGFWRQWWTQNSASIISSAGN